MRRIVGLIIPTIALAGFAIAAPAAAQSPMADTTAHCTVMLRASAAGIAPDSAPVPTELILPPLPAPGSALGQTYVFALWIDSEGRVVADSTRVTPELEPAGYRRRAERAVAGMRFRPAQISGCPVPGWYHWSLALR